MNAEARFWDKAALKYSKQPVGNEEAYQQKLKRTQDFLSPEMHVLEVGCGTGTTALIHAPHVSKITAIDFSQKMLGIAKEKAKAQQINNVEFIEQDILKMDYPNHQFDVVMAHSILHLLQNRDLVLEKIFLTLKPGGYFVTSTPCIEDFFKFFRFIWPIAYRLNIFPYVESFKSQEFLDQLRRHPIEVIEESMPDKRSVFLIAKRI